jgi:hypothetical protein
MSNVEIEWVFQPIPNDVISSSKDNIGLLQKWGIFDNMILKSFSFDKNYNNPTHKNFLNSLITQHLDKFSTIKGQANVKDFKIFYDQLKTTITRMDFFEPLYDHRIVNKDTDFIQKCFDVYLGDITLSDKLRVLFFGASDSFDDPLKDKVFKPEDQEEYLYHIMKRLVIGGSLMQYEDKFEPYFTVVKELYKATVRVQKETNNNISVVNDVFQIKDIMDQTTKRSVLFPENSPIPDANYCYVSVDPGKKVVHVWSFKYSSVW